MSAPQKTHIVQPSQWQKAAQMHTQQKLKLTLQQIPKITSHVKILSKPVTITSVLVRVKRQL